MDFLKQLWHTVKSQAWFVAVTSAVGGALLDMGSDYLVNQSVDFSPTGLKKMGTVVLTAVIAALVHLYRPSPPQQVVYQKGSQKVMALAMIVLLFPAMIPMQGCSVTPAQIKADGQAIAQALDNVAAQISTANPDLGGKLTTAANSIAAITANWQTGNALVEFNDAANAAEIVLAAIPITAPYASLVSIAVAAIDILVANVNPSAVALRAQAGPEASALAEYRNRGEQLIHHRMLRSSEGDLKAAWNEAVKADNLQPTLALK